MDFDIFLHALTSYFVIIDPIGAGVIFAALTRQIDDAATRRLRGMGTLSNCQISILIFPYSVGKNCCPFDAPNDDLLLDKT